MKSALGQQAIEEDAVRRVARRRGAAAMMVVLVLSMPLGALGMGLAIPDAAIMGLFVGPLFGLVPALLVGAVIQLRYVSRWKRELRALKKRS